jgi:hypothetical protein
LELDMSGQRHKPIIGETKVSPNGYHYTYTQKGWGLTSRLMMQEHLGRELTPNERVYFVDGDKNNLKIDNLQIKITKSLDDRLEYLNTQIRRLTEERDELLSRRSAAR